jgi:hypothetical protein
MRVIGTEETIRRMWSERGLSEPIGLFRVRRPFKPDLCATHRLRVAQPSYGIAVGSSLLVGGILELPSVVVRSRTKTWGETTAVDDASFAVLPGQLVVLLGKLDTHVIAE